MIALVLLLLLAQAPPPPEGTAVVGGKVVDKVSGEPIAGAVVVIHTIGSAVLEERTTDSRGMFEFTRLAAGRYYLQATAGPFRYTHVPGGYRAPGADSGAPMELKDGDRRVGLVIELTRSLAIAGRVVDDEGHPLANLEVGVEPMAGAAPRITGRPRTTDDRGTFRIYGLSPGRYTVCAGGRMGASFEPESAPAKQFVRTCYPAHTETAEAAEVVLADTDVEGVEIRMQRRDTFTISGTVLTATGEPATRLLVSLQRIERSGSVGTGMPVRQSSFVISHVVPGTYEVTASLRDEMGGMSEEGPSEWGAARVEVTTANVEGLLVQMKRPASVKGRVTFEGAPPPVIADGFQVVARPVRPSSQTDSPPAKVGPDGTFTLRRLFGALLLRPTGATPPSYVLKSVAYRGRDITWQPTEFDGDPQHEVEIVLTNQTSELSGRVLDETGNPAARAAIVYFPADPARWKVFDRGSLANVRAGSYTVPRLLAGDYFVVALKPEDRIGLSFPDDYERLAAVAERITVLDRESRTADLQIVTLPERPRR